MFYNFNLVPLSVKVPFLVSSSYRKAVQARDQILDIIAKRLENQDSTFLKEAREKSRQKGARSGRGWLTEWLSTIARTKD